MKTKTGLLALGVFTIAGALTVSCGGSSDSTDNTSTAGTTGTSAGTSSGGNSSAGKSSSAGTTNNGAGTANNNGGTATNNGGNANNGGRNNNQGGAPDFPGLGGAGAGVPDCEPGTVNGAPCARTGTGNGACQLNDTTYCGCPGGNDPKWSCIDTGDLGQGGAGGPLGGDVTCPANPKNGDKCTGLGLCPGSQSCGCGLGNVYCQ